MKNKNLVIRIWERTILVRTGYRKYPFKKQRQAVIAAKEKVKGVGMSFLSEVFDEKTRSFNPKLKKPFTLMFTGNIKYALNLFKGRIGFDKEMREALINFGDISK